MVADRGGDGVPARHPLPDRDRRPPAGRGGEPDALAGDARDAVDERLATLRPPSRFAARPRVTLEDFGPAPDFTGNDRWFNCRAADARGAARPRRAGRLLDLHLHQLHPHAAAPGRVGQGLPRRGPDDRRRPLARVHASSARRPTSSARSSRTASSYPVAQDNEMATWNAWSNQYWPAKYLIDARGPRPLRALRRGRLRRDRGRDPRAAASEAGAMAGKPARPTTWPQQATPETYLGAARAERFLPGRTVARHARPTRRTTASFPRATSRSAARWTIDRRVRHRRPGRVAARRRHGQGRLPRAVRSGHGRGDRRRQASRRRSRSPRSSLYHLLSRPQPGSHDLQLRFSPGVAGYAFTFG